MSIDVEWLMGEMTLEEKVGQLFLLAFEADSIDAAQTLFERYFVAGSYQSNDNLPTPAAAAEMTARIQAFAAATRLAIPLLLAADQEGAWSVMYPGSSPGPGNLALGATGDPAHAKAMYEVIGRELRAVGVDANLGPACDCNTNPDNVAIGMRSFGERAESVAAMTEAGVAGALAAGSIATLKHFPGHGDTSLDSHRGLPTVDRSRDELFAIDLLPFERGVAAGAQMIMTAHIMFPALDPDRPATLSPTILGDVLRGELGFDGVILSDSMNMKSMRTNYDPIDAATQAVNAGVDLIMLAEEHYDHDSGYLERQVALIEGITEAVRDGRISTKRLDEAVGRTLRLKASLGDTGELDPASLGSPAHRAIELAAARAAVSTLRGGDAFPLVAGAPLTLVNTALRDAYEVLGSTRGIGPNQTDAAFDLFVAAVRERSPDVRVLSAEQVLAGELPAADGAIVAVTENHTLPGMDFDQSAKLDVLRALADAGRPAAVVALRDPYELREIDFVADYLCTFSQRWCSVQAAAEAVFGEIDVHRSSPVGVPGAGVEAR